MQLATFAARARADSSLTCCQPGLCRSFSAELLSSQLTPGLYFCVELVSSKYRTLLLPLTLMSSQLPISPFSRGPSEWQPGIQNVDCSTLPTISPSICGLSESALLSTKDAKQDWSQYQSLRTTTSTAWFPVGLCTANPQALKPFNPAHFPTIL